MKRQSLIHVVLMIVVACSSRWAVAEDRAAPPATAPSIPVALLDFDANVPGNPDLGKQITEAMTAVLTGEAGFVLVDRASQTKMLTEHELNLTGIVNPDQAAQI